jgi:glycine/D-amino acid oxidase-like deaminating enzyme
MPLRASLAQLHWHKDITEEIPASEGPLPERAEVVVIGGGYMGGATAYWLSRMGAAVVVVERRGVSTGATGRNAGFIAPGLGEAFADGVAKYGREGALERLNFTRRGRDLALAAIRELSIDCDLECTGGLTLASSNAEWKTLQASATLLQREGVGVEIVPRSELGSHFHAPVPEGFLGGVYNPETALVNPVKLNNAVVREAVRRGARLYPYTEVTAITEAADGRQIVETSRGEVTAGWVILATNAWSPLLAGFLRHRIAPVRGQIFATEPAPPTFKRAMSTNYGYEYWSQRADGAIVLGGARWAVEDRDEGYYAEELRPEIQSALYRFLTERFPSLAGVPVARAWSGIMGFSRDGYPFIGPMPGRERLIIIAGFTGHGGPYPQIAGKCVAELIVRGKSEEPLHNYALDRPPPTGKT